MPVNGSDVKVVYYTRSAYNNLSTKDDNTIYYVQETNGRLSLYIGNRAMDYPTESYVDKQDRVKLLRARSGTNALTVHSDTSVTGVGSLLQRGDTIMFEVYSSSAIESVTPKILTATVSSTVNIASVARSITFTTWTGTEMRVYSLSVALISGTLTFGNMNYMRMYKTGTDMVISNHAWTAYIGRIWKVDGDVI